MWDDQRSLKAQQGLGQDGTVLQDTKHPVCRGQWGFLDVRLLVRNLERH